MKNRKEPINEKHGMTGTPEYYSFNHIKGRVLNPKDISYKNYGKRGLSIDPRYLERNGFSNFIKDVGKKPSKNMSIERIDNSKGYVRGNLKWATDKEQSRNRRSNHLLSFEGITKNVTEWAEEVGIRPKTLLQRINEYHWSIEKAITTPTRNISKKII